MNATIAVCTAKDLALRASDDEKLANQRRLFARGLAVINNQKLRQELRELILVIDHEKAYRDQRRQA